MDAVKRYLFCALGAVGMYYAAPWIWNQVAIHAIGAHAQGAILVGLGAVLGGFLAERIGWKGK